MNRVFSFTLAFVAALALTFTFTSCGKDGGGGDDGGPIEFTDAVAAAADYASGDGSQSNPFVIKTAAQLRKLVDESTDKEATRGKYFLLAADINITAAQWTPIEYFRGHFDGGGHEITGTLAGAAMNFGFFGYVEIASIANLDMDVTVTNDYIYDANGNNHTAALCGAIGSSSVTACTVRGSVQGPSGTPTDRSSASCSVGGIAGWFSSGTLTDCVNHATVRGGTLTNNGGRMYLSVGGIAGQNNNTAAFVRCENHGIITGGTATSTTASVYCYVGGICGSGTTLTDCVNTAAVTGATATGATSSACRVGGIAGYLTASSSGCENSGAVTGTTFTGTIGSNSTGGIAGECRSGSILHTGSNSGDVTGGTGGNRYTGGIAGFAYDNVFSCCTNTGTVDGKSGGDAKLVGAGTVQTCTTTH